MDRDLLSEDYTRPLTRAAMWDLVDNLDRVRSQLSAKLRSNPME